MAPQKITPKTITPSHSSATRHEPDYSKINPKVAEKAKEEIKFVKGIFRIYEHGREGSNEKVTCRKYPESICPMFAKTMTDGQEYEIPLYVARFLNGIDSNAEALDGKIYTCSYPTHGWKMNTPGDALKYGEIGYGDVPNPLLTVSKRTRRFGFESLEFSGGM